MQLETKKYLYDIRTAADLLVHFSGGRSFNDYTQDAMFRSAVERQLEIIGEALNQLAKIDPKCAARISEYQRIIAFRNILIHAYTEVDERVVWNVLEQKLPILRRQVEALLQEGETQP